MAILNAGSGKTSAPAASNTAASLAKTYTLAELRTKPKDLDDKKLETYMTDTLFKATFKIDKSTFYKLPAWKQEELKKKVGLY